MSCLNLDTTIGEEDCDEPIDTILHNFFLEEDEFTDETEWKKVYIDEYRLAINIYFNMKNIKK